MSRPWTSRSSSAATAANQPESGGTAADEAALRGASLRLVYASLRERHEGGSLAHDLGRPSQEVMAEDIVETTERRARHRQPGVKVTTDVLPEEAGYGLIRE